MRTRVAFLPLFLLLSILAQPSMGAEPGIAPLKIDLALGSWNGRYLAAISQVSGEIAIARTGFSALLGARAYGSAWFLGTASWDLTALACWNIPALPSWSALDAGLGAEFQIRQDPDERSLASSTWSPLLSFRPRASWRALGLEMPLGLRLYRDGLALRPEAWFSLAWNSWSFRLGAELDCLSLYDSSLSEYRLRSFVGLSRSFMAGGQ